MFVSDTSVKDELKSAKCIHSSKTMNENIDFRRTFWCSSMKIGEISCLTLNVLSVLHFFYYIPWLI